MTTRRQGQALVLIGIIALAVNLRPAAVSIGPVLEELRADLGMSGTVSGVLTSLPVLAFAVFGALAPRAARTVGRHRLVLLALLVVALGLWLRTVVDSIPLFLLFSLLALAGMASANVVLPSLVRQHFPDQVGVVTGIYSSALALGLTGASVLTVPIAESGDGWRDGLLTWALLALVCAVPWVGLALRDRKRAEDNDSAPTGVGITLRQVARTRLGVAMALSFGLQSLQAYAIFGWVPAVYRDAGFTAVEAGLLLGVVTGTSIPLSFIVPALAARRPDIRWLIWTLVLAYPVGYLGLVVAPHSLAILWAAVLGVGTSTFPLVLGLIALRARTADGTAALSGFTQSAGYLMSAIGPFGVGVLHDVTGGWTVPLVSLSLAALPLLWTASTAARPQLIEDQVRA